MALMADRVRETTTTAGTGTVTLDGAAIGYQSFGTAFGSGALVYYVIAGPVEWEIGIGTTGAGTLARTTVLQSTNGDALVPFSAGQKDVFCAYVADRAVTTSDAAALTNKTIDSYTNFVGANQLHIKCKAMANLAKGTVCKITGWNAGENAVEVDAMTSTADLAFGVMYTALTTGSFGEIINTGYLEGINTNAYAPGTILYPNGTGCFTSTKPTSGTYQACAYVLRQQSVNGTIYVEFTNPNQVEASTNTGNTLVLRDGSGNFAAGTITAAAQVVTGDAQVNGMAKLYGPNGSTILNLRDSSGTVDAREWSFRMVSGALEIRSVTDANATQTTVVSFARAGNITVPGSILVSGNSTVTGDLTVDTSTLKVDAANNRVGVNTATPATTLDVNGATTLRGNVSFLADATHDIGASASARPRNVYTSGDAFVAGVRVGRGAGAVTSNTAVGTSALNSASLTGGNNSAIGASAMLGNTTGVSNSAVGATALASNTTGSSNIAIGSQALLSNTTGGVNSAVGSNALQFNTTGAGNSAVGVNALRFIAGSNNVAVGVESGVAILRSVATLGAIVGGSLYTDGTYSGVSLTRSSGSTFGTNPTANITVSGGAVTVVTLVTGGSGFQSTDTVLTATTASIGGTGSGFTVAVATLTGAVSSNNTLLGYQAANTQTEGSSNIAIGSGVQLDSLTGSSQINIGTRYFHDRIRLLERATDPAKPAEGNVVMWMSNGAGLGDDGDVLIGSTAGGVTNYAILFDHSAGTLWP
jgi:hypothetical protein